MDHNTKIKQAKRLMANQKYDKAIELLKTIDQAEARQLLTEARIAQAKQFIAQKTYHLARRILEALNNPEAERLRWELDLQQAQQLIEEKNYNRARKLLDPINTMEAKQLLENLKIKQAEYLITQNLLDEAELILQEAYKPEATNLLEEVLKMKQKTESFQIGLWGAHNAGKTTYLAMLYDALEQSPAWRVYTDEKGREFITAHTKTIRGEKHFPPSTEPSDEDPEEFIYEIYRKSKDEPNTYNRVDLKFLDAPGEYYENPYAPGINILDYLSGCHGLIFLVDPEPPSTEVSDYHNMVLDLLREFHKRSRQNSETHSPFLEQYLAFAATKVDKEGFWERCYQPKNSADKNKANIDKFVIEVMGQSTYNAVSNNYSQEGRYKLFAISSIGRSQNPDTQEWEQNITYPNQPQTSTDAKNTMKRGYTPPSRYQSDVKPEDEEERSLPLSNQTVEDELEEDPFVIINRISSLNVIQPLEWLIDSMLNNPPKIKPSA